MKKKWKILIAIAGILFIVRLILPVVIKNYVNKTLGNLEGYKGHVEDVNLNLFRGAYVIKHTDFVKIQDSIPLPFLSIQRIDLSVHWRALFRGAIVGEVILERPEINFAVAIDPQSGKEVSQEGKNTDWTSTLKELMPLRINRFEITNGKITYRDFSTSPEVDIYLKDLNFLAKNLTNVKDKNRKLPSHVTVRASSIGEGKLSVDADLNILKKIPDFDVDFKFENADVTALNSFLRAYTNTDAQKGRLSLYAEIAADDGKLDGYLKPTIEDLEILDWKNEDSGFLNKVWQSVVDGVTSLFKNHPKDRFASKTPVKGDLNKADTGIWPTIGSILKNTFVEALNKELDDTIDLTSRQNQEETTE